MKITPNVKDFLGPHGDVLSCSNVDDVFRDILLAEIEEVEVSRGDMQIIAMFMLAAAIPNVRGVDINKINLRAWKILEEGRVEKFLGVQLKLV